MTKQEESNDLAHELQLERERHAVTRRELELERVESQRLRALHAELSRQLAEANHRLIVAEPRALAAPAVDGLQRRARARVRESTKNRLARWEQILDRYKGRCAEFDVSDTLPEIQLPIEDGGR